ncbi:MAG: riboflavin synthase [Selenomonadaceae bacterium]|nr:riboflavin synthase [Selenomonadaceae bacterium]
MFTGIIEEVGRIKNIGGGKITIAAKKVLEDINIGDSIAVNGICLTATTFDASTFTADIMPETVRRTSLFAAKSEDAVNLERALTPSTRMGGHIVSGHIDGAGEIVSLAEDKNAVLMKIKADNKILRHIVEKGSVALDGISLTVASVGANDFTVSLIPHTREITNLSDKKIGGVINIETDIIGKYVEKLMQKRDSGNITKDFLFENGFLC